MNASNDRQLITRPSGDCGGLKLGEDESAWRRVAFRLLTFMLLICAVWDRVLRADGWQIVGGCAVTLLLGGIVVCCTGRHRKTTFGPLPIRR